MRAFEYASPKSKEQAVALLGKSWNDAQVLAGGTDLLSLMKDDVVAPKRVVNLKGVEELRGIRFDPRNGLRLGALVTLGRDHRRRERPPALSVPARGRGRARRPADPQRGHRGRQPLPAAALLVLPGRLRPARPGAGRAVHGGGWREPLPRHPGQRGTGLLRQPLDHGSRCSSRWGPRSRCSGRRVPARSRVEKFFRVPKTSEEREHDLAARRDRHRGSRAGVQRAQRQLRGAREARAWTGRSSPRRWP